MFFLALSSGAGSLGSGASHAEPEDDEWSVSLRASDGELYRDVVTIAVEVSKSGARVTRTHTPEKGEARVSRAAVPEKALRELRDTVKAVKAWELGDFRKPVLDAPDYVIELKRPGETHSIRVQGASKSEVHLKLIRAIQRCYPKGVS